MFRWGHIMRFTNETMSDEEQEARKEKIRMSIREQSIFEIITTHETGVAKGDKKLEFSTRNRLREVDGVINALSRDPRTKKKTLTGSQIKAGREHIIRCCILRGIAIFEGYPYVKSLIKMLEENGARQDIPIEEKELYYKSVIKESILQDITRSCEHSKIPCIENSFQYINSVSPIFQIRKYELAYYFFCIGVIEVDCIGEYAKKEFHNVIQAINKKIYHRKSEIECYYIMNPVKPDGFYLNCLENME